MPAVTNLMIRKFLHFSQYFLRNGTPGKGIYRDLFFSFLSSSCFPASFWSLTYILSSFLYHFFLYFFRLRFSIFFMFPVSLTYLYFFLSVSVFTLFLFCLFFLSFISFVPSSLYFFHMCFSFSSFLPFFFLTSLKILVSQSRTRVGIARKSFSFRRTDLAAVLWTL